MFSSSVKVIEKEIELTYLKASLESSLKALTECTHKIRALEQEENKIINNEVTRFLNTDQLIQDIDTRLRKMEEQDTVFRGTTINEIKSLNVAFNSLSKSHSKHISNNNYTITELKTRLEKSHTSVLNLLNKTYQNSVEMKKTWISYNSSNSSSLSPTSSNQPGSPPLPTTSDDKIAVINQQEEKETNNTEYYKAIKQCIRKGTLMKFDNNGIDSHKLGRFLTYEIAYNCTSRVDIEAKEIIEFGVPSQFTIEVPVGWDKREKCLAWFLSFPGRNGIKVKLLLIIVCLALSLSFLIMEIIGV